jgi:hypothetical protein
MVAVHEKLNAQLHSAVRQNASCPEPAPFSNHHCLDLLLFNPPTEFSRSQPQTPKPDPVHSDLPPSRNDSDMGNTLSKDIGYTFYLVVG